MNNQGWKDRRGYHKVSGHVDRPAPVNKRRMMFLLLPTAIAILFMGMLFGEDRVAPWESSSTGDAVVVNADDVRTVINNFEEDRWGQETLDKADLLATNLEKLAKQGGSEKMAPTAAYLRLLISGTGHEAADDAMLTDVVLYLGDVGHDGVTPAILDRYRLALANSAAR